MTVAELRSCSNDRGFLYDPSVHKWTISGHSSNSRPIRVAVHAARLAALYADDLLLTEDAKIKCGRAHFAALEVRDPPARYEVSTSVDGLLDGIGAR